MSTEGLIVGNVYDKYGSTNPLYRRLMRGFLSDLRYLIDEARPRSILEVGCAAGDLAHRVWEPESDGGPTYLGLDVSLAEVVGATRRLPAPFLVARGESLPFEEASFDLVIACEVFEHLREPSVAVREAARVARFGIVASVPWEPIWRGLNLARLAYWRSLGNTPGHLQHFSRGAFRRLLRADFDVVSERRPFPWTMILARKRERRVSVSP